jgi:hypothetical protein
MQLKTQLFIDGKWQDGQSTIAVADINLPRHLSELNQGNQFDQV